MGAGGVCLQERRRRKRSETPAETVSKGWGGPSPPPGHGARPPGRDGMCCGAGGGAGGVNQGPGSQRTGREEPSPAEPSPASRCGCPAPRAGIALFLQPATTGGTAGYPGPAAGTRSPSRRSQRASGTLGCAAGASTASLHAGEGWEPSSPRPPKPQSTRRRLSIFFARKSGENGKPPAGLQASLFPARRESPRRQQHLHGPPGPSAGLPRPPGRAAPVPVPAPATVRRYSPPGTSPSERRCVPWALPPHRRGARRRARPAGPVPVSVPVPVLALVPVPPSGWLHRGPGENVPTGRAEKWGAPVATAAMGIA